MGLEIWTDYPKGSIREFKKLHAGDTFEYEDEFYVKTTNPNEAFNLDDYSTRIFNSNESIQEINLIVLAYKRYNKDSDEDEEE